MKAFRFRYYYLTRSSQHSFYEEQTVEAADEDAARALLLTSIKVKPYHVQLLPDTVTHDDF